MSNDEPGPGHNSVAGDQLKAFCERIERLEEEKRAIADDIKDVYKEAVGNGFDGKVLKKVIALRAMDKDDRDHLLSTTDLYMHALGLI